MAVDATDLRIVTEIQRNGRITNQALADRVGLSPSPCLQRFRKLAMGLSGHSLRRLTWIVCARM